jgi:hypothetical protein
MALLLPLNQFNRQVCNLRITLIINFGKIYIYIYISSYILLGVHTPIFNIPYIQGYYTSLSFLIYLINYSNIPQYK